jgi:membrane-associated phospholipid phosphatase
MYHNKSLHYTNFRTALIICILLALFILTFSFYEGKNNAFLLLNTNLGKPADYFFEYFTNMGDGLLWLVWLVAIFVAKRKYLFPLIISSFVLTTIFTQVFKYVILPDEARPSTAIADQSQIHFVAGVTIHSINSFPSGHTATAFTFVLLIALTVKRRDFLVLAFIVAVLVGYSRIYLGQHFPLDVGAGIIVAILSVSLSVPIYKRLERKREKNLS